MRIARVLYYFAMLLLGASIGLWIIGFFIPFTQLYFYTIASVMVGSYVCRILAECIDDLIKKRERIT